MDWEEKMNGGKDSNIEKLLQDHKIRVRDSAGNEIEAMNEERSIQIGKECGISLRDVHTAAFENGIYPMRYVRNRGVISQKDQLKFLRSSVAVVGAGGLGGYVILMLARMGIGCLVIIDHDSFDETNLNRQAFCTLETLGESKSEAARKAVELVNPGVDVVSYEKKLDKENGAQLLSGCHAAVDALDNVSDRLILQGLCRREHIPLVHGAVAGFEGQVMSIFPEDAGLERLYNSNKDVSNKSQRPENIMGVPGLTPCFIGTMQAMEVVKILIGKNRLLRNVMVHVDMERVEINRFTLKGGS